MINIEIIINTLIAVFVYNIIIKAISNVLIRHALNSKPMQEVNKSFRDKIKDKIKSNEIDLDFDEPITKD